MASASGSEPDYVIVPRSKRAIRQRKCVKIEKGITSSAADTESIKISKTVFPQVQQAKKATDPNDYLRTSTPVGKIAYRRLSQVFQDFSLSPVVFTTDDDKNQKRRNWHKKTKLGNPLLSSTKLHPSMNNDRLSNAVRLYQARVSIKLNEKEAELVTSQLLHKNAMVDTFACHLDENDGEEV